jgi:hypothetical protein
MEAAGVSGSSSTLTTLAANDPLLTASCRCPFTLAHLGPSLSSATRRGKRPVTIR